VLIGINIVNDAFLSKLGKEHSYKKAPIQKNYHILQQNGPLIV